MSASTGSGSVEGAAEAAEAASSALTGKKPGSLGQKVALASAALQLFRRYPVATLCVAGIAMAVYIVRHKRASRITLH